jgi:hypothetical protein
MRVRHVLGVHPKTNSKTTSNRNYPRGNGDVHQREERQESEIELANFFNQYSH